MERRRAEPTLAALLLETYDYVWDRLVRRVDGLTDDEYLWEPVPDCLTIRRLADGTIHRDRGVWPDVQPSRVTTIAWRICHIADNVSEPRIGPLFGQPAFDEPFQSPMSAAGGIAYMSAAYDRWRGLLASVDDDQLAVSLSLGTTPYEGQPLTRFVLQYLEELAHHAAEVALLRDLYRATPPTGGALSPSGEDGPPG